LPFLLLVALSAAVTQNLSLHITLLFLVPLVALITVFSVITHRIALLGEESAPRWGFIRWTPRETYFAVHLALVGCVGLLPILLARVVQFPALILAAPPVLLYVWARLILVFPATAIDARLSLVGSWRLTQNHQLFMVAVVFLMVVFMAIFQRIAAIMIQPLPAFPILLPLVTIPLGVVPIILLSMAYAEIYDYEYGSSQ